MVVLYKVLCVYWEHWLFIFWPENWHILLLPVLLLFRLEWTGNSHGGTYWERCTV